MDIITNTWLGTGLPQTVSQALGDTGDLVTDASNAQALLDRCGMSAATPLVETTDLAALAGIQNLLVKDERTRLGLGSFKALGAGFAIAKQAHARVGDAVGHADTRRQALAGQTYVAATAGNHGLSVAAAAQRFGAQAVIYIAQTVPEQFAARLRAHGAHVIREGKEYEASLAAAVQAARDKGWQLLSDTSWPGYVDFPRDIMEGYSVMAAEIVAAAAKRTSMPSHVFLQAGVGGLAAAVAVFLRRAWGEALKIIVVEPDMAPALQHSIAAGEPVVTAGGVSSMGRLDCKEPSHLALLALAKTANSFLLVSEREAAQAAAMMDSAGFASTPSGAAGFAGLLKAQSAGAIGLDARSDALIILSEGPEDG